MSLEEQIDDFFLMHAHVEKDYKLSWDAYRFLLCDKMFAMRCVNKQKDKIITLKLPPQEGAYYRENYDFICEGYYMNKLHWISILYEQCELSLLKDIIEKSYDAFFSGLSKKLKKELIG